MERNTGETLVLTAYRALCYNQDISQNIFKEHQKGLDALLCFYMKYSTNGRRIL